MPKRARFIGFAFASADFLMEVDRGGRIAFAMGAASNFGASGQEAFAGEDAARFFPPGDAIRFLTHAKALPKGGRAGPFQLKLAQGGGAASVSMFRLPESDNISCAMNKVGARAAAAPKQSDAATGLQSRDAFLAAAEKLGAEGDALTMVDLPDLMSLCESMPPAKADTLLQRVGDVFRGLKAKAAGRISESSFGFVGAEGTSQTYMTGIRALLAENGVSAARIQERLVSLKSNGLAPAQRMLALRHAVDRFAAGEHGADSRQELGGVFRSIVDQTHARLSELTRTVADGSFAMAYQPIVALKDGTLSHYEALARFKPSETGETIRFVEELGLADSFDLAVALKTLSILKGSKDKTLAIAFNISGATIASPESFGLLAGFLARERALAHRVLVEITETSQIADLEDAGKAVKALRDLGIRVGLDDFGAGAASLHYLHALPVDFVKFDGSLVKKMGKSERDDILLRGMIKLCRELGVHTVAEYVETAEHAEQARDLGFDYGQGYYFGMADVRIAPPAKSALFAKRRGIREDWG